MLYHGYQHHQDRQNHTHLQEQKHQISEQNITPPYSALWAQLWLFIHQNRTSNFQLRWLFDKILEFYWWNDLGFRRVVRNLQESLAWSFAFYKLVKTLILFNPVTIHLLFGPSIFLWLDTEAKLMILSSFFYPSYSLNRDM